MAWHSNIKEFKAFKHKDKAKIIKYIELCFGKDSDLNTIQNFNNRQIKAAQHARLSITSQEVINIISFRDEDVNILINTYIGKIQNSNLYDSLISNQYLFWLIQEQMRKPIDGLDDLKKRTELSKLSEEVEKRISNLTDKIYGTGETKDMGAKVIRMSYEQRIIPEADVS